MIDFGDAEPEDAWDADDDVADLVANLARRVRAALVDLDRYDVDARARLRSRLRMIVDDLGHVVARIEAGQL